MKVLGLDLGTNSIGWGIVESIDGEKQIAKFGNQPTYGSLIFTEGVKKDSKGKDKSRAAERTAFRGARKLKFRRKLRKYETLKVLIEYDMCPLSDDELAAWRYTIDENTDTKSTFKKYPKNSSFLEWLKTDESTKRNPYYYRSLFATEKKDWETNKALRLELGRALYHLAQRRGFKSNRLEQTDDSLLDETRESLEELVNSSISKSDFETEFQDYFSVFDFENQDNELDENEKKVNKLWKSISYVIEKETGTNFSELKEKIIAILNRSENIGPVKGGIKDLSKEISNGGFETLGQYFWSLYQKNRVDPQNKIRAKYTGREEHYITEFEHIARIQQFKPELAEKLSKAIFYQRPLRSQKGTVGSCTFEKNKTRCPISRPEFEEFRMWSFINSIKVKSPSDSELRRLNSEEIERILPKFYRRKETFEFSELCKAINSKGSFFYRDNIEEDSDAWEVNYSLHTQVTGCPTVAALRTFLGEDWDKTNINYVDVWHAWFSFDDTTKLAQFGVDKLGLDELKSKKFARVKLKQGYSNLSTKAISKILPWLKHGLLYSHAVFMANMDAVIKPEIWADKDSRTLIESELKIIIDTQVIETLKVNAVNSVLKKKATWKYTNIEDEEVQIDILTQQFEAVFGEHTWQNLGEEEQKNLLNEAKEILQKQLKRTDDRIVFVRVLALEDRIHEFLNNNDLVKSPKAFEKLYHPSDMDEFKPIEFEKEDGTKLNVLPLPKTDSIKNPVLMRAMYKLRSLVNELLITGAIDSDTRIHIELAREVNDANKRAAWKTWQDKLKKQKDEAVTEIKTFFKEKKQQDIEPTEDDIERYILWIEQDKRMIYEDECNQICITSIIGSDPDFDIEHTIPRSKSWDNSRANKTLCSKHFNREIKRNQIPFELSNHEEILNRVQHWKKHYLDLDAKIKKINTAGVSDKKTKDERIQKRHVLTFERDYFRNKYQRFVMKDVPEGFKNSQITDTGLITRFARKYLTSVFKTDSGNSNVNVVNGVAVAEFRKAWGVQKLNEKKSRSNHAHHCVDALTIACISRKEYQLFAEKWREAEEDYEKYGVSQRLFITPPWDSFSEDLRKIEDSLLVVHEGQNVASKTTKKKLRRRGKIVFKKGTQEPIIVQGDSARGSLHEESYYGCIINPESGKEEFVIRKYLSEVLAKGDLSSIIDPTIRKICIEASKQEKNLKKEIDDLNKQAKFAQTDEAHNQIKMEIEAIDYRIKNELYVLPNTRINGTPTPIKKVRVKAWLQNPLKEFKNHRDFKKNVDGSVKHPHKTEYYVQNDENYGLALYEDPKTLKRDAQIVNMMKAATYFKTSNKDVVEGAPLTEPIIKNKPFKVILKKLDMVLFWDKNPAEIWSLTTKERRDRLYYIKQIAKNGQTTFQFHQEARDNKGIKEDYLKEFNVEAPGILLTGFSKFEIVDKPKIRFQIRPNNMNMLIEGLDFKMTKSGNIIQIK